MGLLATLAAPLRGARLLRRLLVEVRGIRRALERQADALELSSQAGAPRDTVGQQAFRSYSQSTQQVDEKGLRGLTEVSYTDDAMLSAMLEKEEELRAVLGRDPSEAELEASYRGEVG